MRPIFFQPLFFSGRPPLTNREVIRAYFENNVVKLEDVQPLKATDIKAILQKRYPGRKINDAEISRIGRQEYGLRFYTKEEFNAEWAKQKQLNANERTKFLDAYAQKILEELSRQNKKPADYKIKNYKAYAAELNPAFKAAYPKSKLTLTDDHIRHWVQKYGFTGPTKREIRKMRRLFLREKVRPITVARMATNQSRQIRAYLDTKAKTAAVWPNYEAKKINVCEHSFRAIAIGPDYQFRLANNTEKAEFLINDPDYAQCIAYLSGIAEIQKNRQGITSYIIVSHLAQEYQLPPKHVQLLCQAFKVRYSPLKGKVNDRQAQLKVIDTYFEKLKQEKKYDPNQKISAAEVSIILTTSRLHIPRTLIQERGIALGMNMRTKEEHIKEWANAQTRKIVAKRKQKMRQTILSEIAHIKGATMGDLKHYPPIVPLLKAKDLSSPDLIILPSLVKELFEQAGFKTTSFNRAKAKNKSRRFNH